MPVRDLVLRVDRRCEGLDGAEIQVIQLVEVSLGVVETAKEGS
jgi:hypothetical protein